MLLSVRAWAVVVVLSSIPALAAAQDAEAEARARFEAGRIALAAGHAESALADFRAAYELSGRPELLYNVGVAADRLRHDAEALEAFERYLAEMPADQIVNRAEVEARITTLRATLADPTETEAPAPTPAPPGPDVGAIVLLAVGGVVLVGGAIALGLGISDRASVADAPMGASWPAYADAASRAPILEGVGGGALGLGAALVLGGAIMLATSSGTPDRPAIAVRTHGIGLAVGGTF